MSCDILKPPASSDIPRHCMTTPSHCLSQAKEFPTEYTRLGNNDGAHEMMS